VNFGALHREHLAAVAPWHESIGSSSQDSGRMRASEWSECRSHLRNGRHGNGIATWQGSRWVGASQR
jgi:hypothetical protein